MDETTIVTRREKYLSFLKELLKDSLNENGCYELFWDYSDGLNPRDIREAIENYKDSGYVTFTDYLAEKLYELNFDGDSEMLAGIKKAVEASDDAEILAEHEKADFYESVQEAGYNGIDVNLDGLISNTSIYVNIMLATEKEENYDMASIVTAYGHYKLPDVHEVDEDVLDNALTWLIHQQGYSVCEVFKCLFENPTGFGYEHENNFVESIVDEIVNNTSEALSEVTMLVRLSGQQIIDFFNYFAEDGTQNICIKKNAEVGIFNEWAGCGGCIGILLDKDVVVPKSMIRGYQIEDSGESSCVGDVYGLSGAAYKDVLSFTEENPVLFEEKENVLEKIVALAEE